jgi:hypothetical protein
MNDRVQTRQSGRIGEHPSPQALPVDAPIDSHELLAKLGNHGIEAWRSRLVDGMPNPIRVDDEGP